MELQDVYVSLDALSALLTLAVAAGFARLARWTHQGRHYLVATGFALVATGFLFVASSQFTTGLRADWVDLARIGFQLGGAILLLYAYTGVHLTGRAYTALVAVAWFETVVLLGMGLWLIPPVAHFAPFPEALAAAYGMAAICYLGCAILSGYGWHRRPTWGRAMVPLAFLAWMLSMYTWIFIVSSPDQGFLPVVYGWRFLAILLLLWAMVRRPRFPVVPGGSDAAP